MRAGLRLLACPEVRRVGSGKGFIEPRKRRLDGAGGMVPRCHDADMRWTSGMSSSVEGTRAAGRLRVTPWLRRVHLDVPHEGSSGVRACRQRHCSHVRWCLDGVTVGSEGLPCCCCQLGPWRAAGRADVAELTVQCLTANQGGGGTYQ